MTSFSFRLRTPILTAATRRVSVAGLAAALVTAALPAGAEKADRYKPMVIEADKDLVADDRKQVVVYNGNAVLSQGTMLLRAERIEVRELPDGYRAATAIGTRAKPASWRQRRDGVDETVEGSAERIEFDGRADTLRFVGQAGLRRLRGAGVAEEITGGVVVWDNITEVFTVEAGDRSAANPTGRVRTVLTPRADPAAAPPSAPTGSPTTAPKAAPLAPVRSLEERR
jgi:lipopolysaccharide export system protein LptA